MFIYYVVERNGELWNPKNARLPVALGEELDRDVGSGRNWLVLGQ